MAPLTTGNGQIAIVRAQPKYATQVAVASKSAYASVSPWMGPSLVPTTTKAASKTLNALEAQRSQGFGITYLLLWQERCLGMGLINYIHPLHGNANLGVWLTPDARGRGIAVNLCKRLMELANETMGLRRLELFILPDNHASIKLAQALGAEKEGLCRQRILGKDAYLYSILLASTPKI